MLIINTTSFFWSHYLLKHIHSDITTSFTECFQASLKTQSRWALDNVDPPVDPGTRDWHLSRCQRNSRNEIPADDSWYPPLCEKYWSTNLGDIGKMLTLMYLSIHHFIKICSQEILLNVLRWQYSWGTSGNKTDKSTEQTYMKYLDKSKLRPIAVLLWFRPKECRLWLRFFGRGSEEKLLGQESNLKTPCRLQNSPKCIIWERSGVIWGNLGTIWIDLGMQNHSVSK